MCGVVYGIYSDRLRLMLLPTLIRPSQPVAVFFALHGNSSRVSQKLELDISTLLERTDLSGWCDNHGITSLVQSVLFHHQLGRLQTYIFSNSIQTSGISKTVY